MKYPKRSQYKYAKSQYRVRNWPEYEAGLKKRRGSVTFSFAGFRPIGRSTYSSTVQGSELTSAICKNRPGTGLGGSSTSLLMLIQVRSSRRICPLAERMTALRSRTCLSSLMTPLRPYPPTARMTPGPFTKLSMSEAKDGQYGS